jgi:hypothetical protein
MTRAMNTALPSVPANAIGFNGHKFNVGLDVPEEIIEKFVTHFQNTTLYADLPEELLEWELELI